MSSLVEVAPGVLVATSRFEATTTTVVLDDAAGALVIDPGVAADEIEQLADQLAAQGRRVVLGFSTHPHWDHLLWSRRWPDVRRYALAGAVDLARIDRATLWQEARDSGLVLDPTGFAEMVAMPADATHLPWDGPGVEVVAHPGHCPGHCALLVEDRGVLVAGDMLSDLEIPLPDLTSPDPVGTHLSGLQRLAQCLDRVEVVVPGHGAVTDGAGARTRLDADRRYLERMRHGAATDDPRLRLGPAWMRQEELALRQLLAD